MKRYVIGLITLSFIVFAGDYASADWAQSSESSARGVEFLRDIIEDMHRETTEATEEATSEAGSEEFNAYIPDIDHSEGNIDEGDIDDIDLAGLGGDGDGDDDEDDGANVGHADGGMNEEFDAVGGGTIGEEGEEVSPEGMKRVIE